MTQEGATSAPCQECGEPQLAGSNFCSNCGAKLVDKEIPELQEGKPSEGKPSEDANINETIQPLKKEKTTTSKPTELKSLSITNPHTTTIKANKQKEVNNKKEALIGGIFHITSIIAHCIGLYGICTFRNEINSEYYDDQNISTVCMDSVSEVIRSCNLPIGGLSVVFAMELLWLLYFWCLTCPNKEDEELEQGILGCGGCYLISHILATLFWSFFLFGEELEMFQKNCGDGVWNDYAPFCYFSYAWILLQWVIMFVGLCYVCLSSMFGW